MILKFDHIVICVDNDPGIIDKLSEEINSSNIPFRMTAGREGKGFKTSVLWIGKRYLEIVQFLTAEGEGFPQHWVKRLKEGKRGIFALFFGTSNLDSLYGELKERYLNVQKNGSSILGSILEALNLQIQKRHLYLPEIPGTGFEIDFEPYDEKSRENSAGESAQAEITGVSKIKVFIPEWAEGLEFLKKIFPELTEEKMEKRISLENDSEVFFYRTGIKEPAEVQLEVFVSNQNHAGKKIKIANLEIKTVLKTEK